MRKRDILSIYASGLCELVLSALGAAVLSLMIFQTLGKSVGLSVNAEAILLFSWQIIVFMALWPGQTFWTIRRKSSVGYEHSVIGVPSDDDMRLENHRRARRLRDARRH